MKAEWEPQLKDLFQSLSPSCAQDANEFNHNATVLIHDFGHLLSGSTLEKSNQGTKQTSGTHRAGSNLSDSAVLEYSARHGRA